MTSDHSSSDGPPHWSFAGFELGLRLALPVLPGMIAFGLAVGATAARKGFGFLDHLLMNLFVYAGMSQMVAMEVWPSDVGIVSLVGLAVLCATINARMLLMSASLQPVARRASGVADLSGAAPPHRSRLADRDALSG